MFKTLAKKVYLSLLIMSTSSLAIEAPTITDQVYLESTMINFEEKIPCVYKGKTVQADFIEEESIASWSQGKRLFTEDFLQPLISEDREATRLRILNPQGKLMEINSSNVGPTKFFEKLDSSHYGKLGGKYALDVPYLWGRMALNHYGWAVYLDALSAKSFTIYFIFNPNDFPQYQAPALVPAQTGPARSQPVRATSQPLPTIPQVGSSLAMTSTSSPVMVVEGSSSPSYEKFESKRYKVLYKEKKNGKFTGNEVMFYEGQWHKKLSSGKEINLGKQKPTFLPH